MEERSLCKSCFHNYANQMLEIIWVIKLPKQTISLQFFESVSSANFTWFILEYLDPYTIVFFVLSEILSRPSIISVKNEFCKTYHTASKMFSLIIQKRSATTGGVLLKKGILDNLAKNCRPLQYTS